MPATIFIENPETLERYTFPQERLPLVGITRSFSRGSDQGAALIQKQVTLSGFLEGNSHYEIMSLYGEISTMLDSGYVRLYYNDGVQDPPILDKLVHIGSYTQPSSWKEYDGEFTIDGTFSASPLDEFSSISATYVHSGGQTYTFPRLPQYAKNTEIPRGNFNENTISPGGKQLGTRHKITLNGFLYYETSLELRQAMDSLDNAFRNDGTLNYMGWSWPCFSDGVQFQQSTPLNHVFYSIALTVVESSYYEIQCGRKISRLHPYLQVTHRPYCGTPHVSEFPEYNGGQVVSYDISVTADTLSIAQAAVASEKLVIVTAGGIEQAGGVQSENFMKNSCQLSFSLWYSQPPFPNL